MSFDPDAYLATLEARRGFDPDAYLQQRATPPSPALPRATDLFTGVTIKQPKAPKQDDELPVNRALGATLRAEDRDDEGPLAPTAPDDDERRKWPVPSKTALKTLQEIPESREAFEETYGPGAAAKYA